MFPPFGSRQFVTIPAAFVFLTGCGGAVPSSGLSAEAPSRAAHVEAEQPAAALQLRILTTTNPDDIQRWADRQKVEERSLEPVRRIRPGEAVHAVFSVAGATGGRAGVFRYHVDWKLRHPDGTLVFEQHDFASGQGVAGSPPTWSLAAPALDLSFEARDPKGRYSLEATVRDGVSHRTATTAIVLELIE